VEFLPFFRLLLLCCTSVPNSGPPLRRSPLPRPLASSTPIYPCPVVLLLRSLAFSVVSGESRSKLCDAVTASIPFAGLCPVGHCSTTLALQFHSNMHSLHFRDFEKCRGVGNPPRTPPLRPSQLVSDIYLARMPAPPPPLCVSFLLVRFGARRT